MQHRDAMQNRVAMQHREALRRATLISRTLAGCLVLVLLSRWELVQTLFGTSPTSLLGGVLIVLLGLLVASVAGLALVRPWGFWAVYALVPVATVLHGIALVPFVVDLLPSIALRAGGVLVLNLAFLAATVVAHRSYRSYCAARSASAASASSAHSEMA